MWGKNKKVVQYQRDEEEKTKPLAFPEIMYGTEISECHMSPTTLFLEKRNVIKFFTDLKDAARESLTHKVAIYRLDRTTCVEYVQPEPVVRTIDCEDAEKKEKA